MPIRGMSSRTGLLLELKPIQASRPALHSAPCPTLRRHQRRTHTRCSACCIRWSQADNGACQKQTRAARISQSVSALAGPLRDFALRAHLLHLASSAACWLLLLLAKTTPRTCSKWRTRRLVIWECFPHLGLAASRLMGARAAAARLPDQSVQPIVPL